MRCTALHFVGAKLCTQCGQPLRLADFREGTRPCPRCSNSLGVVVLAEHSLGECSKCGGLWAERLVLERIVAQSERASIGPGVFQPQMPTVEQAIRYLKCPVCTKVMNRINFGRRSGVIVDVCKHDGVWFDAGELAAAVSFVAGGGLSETLRREKEELRDELQRARENIQMPAHQLGDRAHFSTVDLAAGLSGQDIADVVRTLGAMGGELFAAVTGLWRR